MSQHRERLQQFFLRCSQTIDPRASTACTVAGTFTALIGLTSFTVPFRSTPLLRIVPVPSLP